MCSRWNFSRGSVCGIRRSSTGSAISREELARRGATAWMEMIFRDGFYHADPHPGNLLVMEDGIIGIMDCGMVGRIDEGLRESIEELLVTIANLDAPMLARILTRLCAPPPGFDETAFSADLSDFVSYYGSQPIERFRAWRRPERDRALRFALPSRSAKRLGPDHQGARHAGRHRQTAEPEAEPHFHHRRVSAENSAPPVVAPPAVAKAQPAHRRVAPLRQGVALRSRRTFPAGAGRQLRCSSRAPPA